MSVCICGNISMHAPPLMPGSRAERLMVEASRWEKKQLHCSFLIQGTSGRTITTIDTHRRRMQNTPLIDAIAAALLCLNVAQTCRLLAGPSQLEWRKLHLILAGRPVAALPAASKRLQFPACQMQLAQGFIERHSYGVSPSFKPHHCTDALCNPTSWKAYY